LQEHVAQFNSINTVYQADLAQREKDKEDEAFFRAQDELVQQVAKLELEMQEMQTKLDNYQTKWE
jgi:hypothetical protein